MVYAGGSALDKKSDENKPESAAVKYKMENQRGYAEKVRRVPLNTTVLDSHAEWINTPAENSLMAESQIPHGRSCGTGYRL